jgi:hypothetical protein
MTWEPIFPFVLVIAALSLPLGKVFTRPMEEAEENGTNEAGTSALSEAMKRPLRAQPFESSVSKKPSVASPSDGGGAYAGKRHSPLFRVNAPEARRGIVLMTILGPCRAFDPPNPKD